jgi:hypothetical protein
MADCLELGLTVTQSTVDWWNKQPQEARAAWDIQNPPKLQDVLTELNLWMRTFTKDEYICPWGNGADFDLVILKSAYEAVGADPPWKYYNHHCYRTLKNLATSKVPNGGLPRREGVHHNALDDAIHQAKCAIVMANALGLQL